MRRKARIKNKQSDSNFNKIIMYCLTGIAILTIILVGLLLYSKSLNNKVKEGTMTLEQMANINKNSTENTTTQSASTQIGKTVEEAEETQGNTTNSSSNQTGGQNTVNTNSNTSNSTNTNTSSTSNTNTQTNQVNSSKVNKQEETTKELSFIKPVDGEIMKDYSKDNLIYSETLKEWTTHLGIDIKAEKTTIVKSAEAGTIKSIKNDPRYGLTIVIEHENGFQTVYSNLLTSEFVVEGEQVEKGQSIGTVGNTAIFEIADGAHLHFEILKNSVQEDPNIYIK